MKNRFSVIALSTTSQSDRVLSIASQCNEVLSNLGIKVLIDGSLDKLRSEGLSVSSKGSIISKAKLLIAIGGDGTMLNCSRKFGSEGIPILGINLGNLGFLADIDPKDITSSLLNVIEGKFEKDERFFLEGGIEGNKSRFLALNEIVVHSGKIAQLIEFSVFIDESFVYRQKADGLIISSPTGSTAYSLSGGGPIVHPDVNTILLVSMLPHNLSTRPLLVEAGSEIRIELENKKSILSFDSHENLSLKGKSIVRVYKAKSSLTLIHPQGQDFFASCRNKLGWSTNP
jgi:NAD+ kinase|tara:strand:- start:227 stop:1084 length:858 start_codon:yes stop_codon:yes gene_type:complete